MIDTKQKGLTERGKLIEYMLSEVESDLEQKHRTNEFIESLRDWFTTCGDLTEKQLEALRKFYERV